ncbi:hypothetical protein EX30DRAFT_273082 [Ascodesmis nigricans]|uniref:Uncharacterized protein n=1 Tax=Ascodesmis nigricans TaxID=341454 RepID=A0A4S2MXI4_9PEZI|nr:hypothetical protein EX30DRAFT_273082 [Ascodesmis nigricans]
MQSSLYSIPLSLSLAFFFSPLVHSLRPTRSDSPIATNLSQNVPPIASNPNNSPSIGDASPKIPRKSIVRSVNEHD